MDGYKNEKRFYSTRVIQQLNMIDNQNCTIRVTITTKFLHRARFHTGENQNNHKITYLQL